MILTSYVDQRGLSIAWWRLAREGYKYDQLVKLEHYCLDKVYHEGSSFLFAKSFKIHSSWYYHPSFSYQH
jgi:hypothetical protein